MHPPTTKSNSPLGRPTGKEQEHLSEDPIYLHHRTVNPPEKPNLLNTKTDWWTIPTPKFFVKNKFLSNTWLLNPAKNQLCEEILGLQNCKT